MADFDLERAKKVRDFNKNPPKKEVGLEMGDNPWAAYKTKMQEASQESKQIMEGASTNTNDNMGLITGNESGLPGVSNGGQPNVNLGNFTQNPQQMGTEGSKATKTEETVLMVLGEIGNTFKGLLSSFKGMDIELASTFGYRMLFGGGIVFVSGLIFCILGFIFNVKRPFALCGGGILMVSWGLLVQSMVYNKTVSEDNDEEPEESQDDIAAQLLSMQNQFKEFDEEVVEPVEEDNEEPANFTQPAKGIETLNIPTVKTLPMEEVVKDLDRINPEMYTRQFLYERFVSFIPRRNPNFNKMTELSEHSEVFLKLETILREACRQVGIKENNLPMIDKLEENSFIYRIIFERKGITRTQDIANEVANSYRYDDMGKVIHEGSYARVIEFANTVIISLFKGTNAIVSLGDIFPVVKDFILDTNNMFPIVLGIDEMGQPMYHDFKKIDSVIISGLPRSGKSLTMQSIVTQMCMFCSPKELNIHIMDLKDGVSDFQGIETPHIKSFSRKPEECLNIIRYIVNEVGPQRAEFLKSYGEINILDFKENHPDVDFPFIYVIVDEMMKLADTMTKDEKAEFQGLLSSLISMMPALGVRVILIPHRIVNDVISKNSYSLVPCRINVRGKDEELQKALGITQNNFGYRLSNQGDAGVMLNGYRNGEPFFCHSAVLSEKRNEVKKTFELINIVWGKVKIDSPNNFKEEVKSQEKLDDFWD